MFVTMALSLTAAPSIAAPSVRAISMRTCKVSPVMRDSRMASARGLVLGRRARVSGSVQRLPTVGLTFHLERERMRRYMYTRYASIHV